MCGLGLIAVEVVTMAGGRAWQQQANADGRQHLRPTRG